MSRKSRYVTEEPLRNPIAKWRAGAYIRLSREDEDAKDKDSQSVTTQKRMIDKFLSEHSDIELFDYYIDDGFSGTTMDRPSFQRLKNDFENGAVNCIIVKDLSRFARNDDESGRYIYVIFPFYKIRFISINDRVDSVANPNSVNNLEIPFKNIMHSEYSRDLSKKVRSASNMRRKRGEFIGAFCSYGYKKDPNDLHRLIVDEEAAEIVKYIYRRYIETENFLQIAKELSAQNVLTPLAYKISHGHNLRLPNKQISATVWKDGTIKRILTNETYLGHLTQGKRRTISYKNKKQIETDESEWIKVENTHEPIISTETFATVQTLLAKNKRVKVARCNNQNLFAQKLFCGSCGAAMSLTRSGTGVHVAYYHCNIAYLKNGACTPKRIRADKLEKAVLETLDYHLKLCANATRVLARINSAIKNSVVQHSTKSDKLQAELIELQNIKNELYGKYKEGRLTREEYFGKKTETGNKMQAIEQAISSASSGAPKALELGDLSIISEFVKYRKFSKLTREILTAFVERVVVFSPTEIEIHLSFADEFAKIQEYIQSNSMQINAKSLNVIS